MQHAFLNEDAYKYSDKEDELTEKLLLLENEEFTTREVKTSITKHHGMQTRVVTPQIVKHPTTLITSCLINASENCVFTTLLLLLWHYFYTVNYILQEKSMLICNMQHNDDQYKFIVCVTVLVIDALSCHPIQETSHGLMLQLLYQ